MAAKVDVKVTVNSEKTVKNKSNKSSSRKSHSKYLSKTQLDEKRIEYYDEVTKRGVHSVYRASLADQIYNMAEGQGLDKQYKASEIVEMFASNDTFMSDAFFGVGDKTLTKLHDSYKIPKRDRKHRTSKSKKKTPTIKKSKITEVPLTKSETKEKLVETVSYESITPAVRMEVGAEITPVALGFVDTENPRYKTPVIGLIRRKIDEWKNYKEETRDYTRLKEESKAKAEIAEKQAVNAKISEANTRHNLRAQVARENAESNTNEMNRTGFIVVPEEDEFDRIWRDVQRGERRRTAVKYYGIGFGVIAAGIGVMAYGIGHLAERIGDWDFGSFFGFGGESVVGSGDMTGTDTGMDNIPDEPPFRTNSNTVIHEHRITVDVNNVGGGSGGSGSGSGGGSGGSSSSSGYFSSGGRADGN